MPVKDLEFTALDARKFTRRGERAQIDRLDQNSTVSMILPIDDATADIEFRFTVSYGSVASIRIEGRLLFTGDARGLAASWRDKNLPPPLPLPQVRFDQQGSQGTTRPPTYSPEVG